MKKPGPRKSQGGSQKKVLLGDLESIRTLLDDEATIAPEVDGDVPLLDDVVDGGMRLDETPFARRATIDVETSGGLDDELFNTLLGDSWKESAGRILEQTRAAIEEHRTAWAPQDTDALNEALRVRIDAALKQWLQALVHANIDALRARLLEVTQRTIQEEVDGRLGGGPPAARKRKRD